MICRQLAEGPCKTYLLVSPKTREAVLVDPLLEKAEEHLRLLRDESLSLRLVIDTHTHADHLSAATLLRDTTGVPYLMHSSTQVASVSRKAQDGEVIGIGDMRLTFLHTPGHTSDSLSLLLGDRLLSGDFLFLGSYGAGRLDLPGSDPSVHYDSLRKLDGLPDSLIVLPAHDYQGLSESVLGEERKANPVLSARTRDAYLRWWSERKFGPADWMTAVVSANVAGARDCSAVAIPKAAAACACAAGPSPAETGLPLIAARDLAFKLHHAPGSAVLLDVRTPEEYNDELGHLAGSLLIPIDELKVRLKEVPPGAVVAVCRSGKRAARAAEILRAAGRSQVWVLAGGMLAWNEARLPIA